MVTKHIQKAIQCGRDLVQGPQDAHAHFNHVLRFLRSSTPFLGRKVLGEYALEIALCGLESHHARANRSGIASEVGRGNAISELHDIVHALVENKGNLMGLASKMEGKRKLIRTHRLLSSKHRWHFEEFAAGRHLRPTSLA